MLHSINRLNSGLVIDHKNSWKSGIDPVRTGENLRYIRRKVYNLSQEQLSGVLEENGFTISTVAISNLERGISLPKLETLAALAYLYDYTIDDLVVTYGQTHGEGNAA